MNNIKTDLARVTLGVIFIVVLLVATLWVVQPFLPALIWATMITIATWPLLQRLERALGGRRIAATLIMTLILLLLFVIPMSIALANLASNLPALIDWATALKHSSPPELLWLQQIPFVGGSLFDLWQQILESGGKLLFAKLSPYIGVISKTVAAQLGNIGMLVVHFMLTVAICGLLYCGGDRAADRLRQFAQRLAGPRGSEVITLASQAIRAVALGVVLTALIQATFGGIGLMIAGIPYAMVLGVVMFLLTVAQIGSVPVLLSATAYLFWSDATSLGIFMLIWTMVAGTMDNVIRPFLIKLGADLPIILILVGVIGGMLGFGIIGLFIGPVVLAVTYTLLDAWMDEERI